MFSSFVARRSLRSESESQFRSERASAALDFSKAVIAHAQLVHASFAEHSLSVLNQDVAIVKRFEDSWGCNLSVAAISESCSALLSSDTEGMPFLDRNKIHARRAEYMVAISISTDAISDVVVQI